MTLHPRREPTNLSKIAGTRSMSLYFRCFFNLGEVFG
jgi:hypothetical protein